jgi:hypothetical protein
LAAAVVVVAMDYLEAAAAATLVVVVVLIGLEQAIPATVAEGAEVRIGLEHYRVPRQAVTQPV